MMARRVALWLVCLGLWVRVALAADPAGQVASLEGSAEVTRAGATQPVKPGDPIYVGDKLKAAPGGKLRLLLNDESVLTLAANTELVVNEQVLGTDTSKSTLGLLGGTLRAIVTERYSTPGSKFEVETPTAIAGVRGTGFVITYDTATGTTTVTGLFDTTWVRDRNGRGEVTVGPNRSTEVRRGGVPRAPITVDGSRLQRLLDATDARVTLDAGEVPAGGDGASPAGGGRRQGGPRRMNLGRTDALGTPAGIVDQPVEKLRKLKSRVPTGSPPPHKPPPPPPSAPGLKR